MFFEKTFCYMLLGILFVPSKILGDVCSNCNYRSSHGMLIADCYKRELETIPKCLRKNIEVLEFTLNRIREITKSDINQFSNLKILYLGSNTILRIEEDAFNDLTNLITLDLSKNVLIDSIPLVIFKLPSLRKLYLGQNDNEKLAEIVNKSKPITSPLFYIDISYNYKKSYLQLPEFGPIPTLLSYNISGNKVKNFSWKNIAGLCKLQQLINDNVSLSYDDYCDCWTVNKWMKEKQIKFKPFNCPGDENSCTYNDSMITIEYDICYELHSKMVLKRKLLTIALPICAVLLVAILIAIYCYCRRRKRNLRAQKKKKKINIKPNKYKNDENDSFIN